MNRSVLRLGLVVLFAAVFASFGTPAYAQTQTISGTVVDGSGAVIPGADIAAKHAGTGVVSNAVSNTEGQFSLPGMQIGTYTVTVTLQGFKTVVVNNVVLTAGAPASVKATMEVGGVSEQVTVSSSSEIVQTQSSTVSTTITPTRFPEAADHTAARWTSSTCCPACRRRPAHRDATINGLPRGTINITLDGVNIQDNTLRARPTGSSPSSAAPRRD